MTTLTGALHVHSTFSDGERSLAELRALFLDDGCRFAAVADHADDFDDERLGAYLDECRRLSDERFVFLPGLEFTCERRMHIVGYGMTALTDARDPEIVIEQIRSENGIAVIAHPQDTAFAWIESFKVLPDGLEVWNTKYDGRYAPRGRTFRLLYRLQQRKPDMLAFYGQDLHWIKQHRGLRVKVEAEALSPEALLGSLRVGNFSAVRDELAFPSNGAIDPSLLDQFERANARAARIRGWVSAANRLRRRLGAEIPAPLKNQLRRFF